MNKKTTMATILISLITLYYLPVSGLVRNKREENFRQDCPIFKNFCIGMPHCPPGKKCAMDMNCQNKLCVSKSTSQPDKPTSQPEKPTSQPDKPTSQPEKPTSQPDTFVDKNTRQQTTTHAPVDSNLRPVEERLCRDRGIQIVCVHGYCNTTTSMSYCVCDKGWQQRKCDLPCNLECVHGDCFVDSPDLFIQPDSVTTQNMTCTCHAGWQSRLCDEEIPDLVGKAEERTLTIGLSMGTALMAVIAISIAVLFVMWRKRVIVVMKLVYFFKLDEDNDGRIYDAYVSMGSSTSGMDFVKDELCPKLQSRGFKLYIQARDQLPGEVPSDSILMAMEHSRRTILIITPGYLKNEWSRFECITAQIETLKLRQRIIPIILEDVSTDKENMNRTLRHILDSAKCLRVPRPKQQESGVSTSQEVLRSKMKKEEDKFWERMYLTMPKKKGKPESNESFTNLNHVV